MKYTRTITLVKDKEISTEISTTPTINGVRFIMVHYVNGEEHSLKGFYRDIPDYEELRIIHNLFVKSQL